MKIEKICVVGLGYVGLPTAAILADSGVQVLGYDVSERAVKTINEGKAHIKETDLDEVLARNVKSGQLRASTTPEKADIFVIAVPTPFLENKAPDMTYVVSAAEAIAKHLEKGNLVILESTSPVGSTDMIAEKMAVIRPDLTFTGENPDILLAYCPERILPGQTLKELVENSRSIGGITREAAVMAAEMYRKFCKGELVLTNAKTAEMTKLVENSFRDVNIAFANELSVICDTSGINVHEVISLANRHPRVNILSPGTGVGGHCIPVDPWFIVNSNPNEAKLIKQARLTNDDKPVYIAKRLIAKAKAEGKTKIGVLGLTYKPDVDDFRHSPAFDILAILGQEKSLSIFVSDPYIECCHEELPASVEKKDAQYILDNCELVIINTPHQEYRSLEFKTLISTESLIDPAGIVKAA